ncbi:MAG: 4Fe-4S dicluster domain-containing protein [Calditrichaeota bacterium]|nr:4Fe-4S dicluster domain-containing protein [Calditrichota bacterium]
MTITRRDFLKATGIAGATGLLSIPTVAQAQEFFPGWPDRYGVLNDCTLCIGCRRCEEACNRVNGNPPPKVPLDDKSVFNTVRRTDAKNFTVVNRFPNPNRDKPPIYVKRQCMHCNEPACASACLVAAFSKTAAGAVLYNSKVCIGCRYCMTACPFYVPSYEYDSPYTPRVVKCTMCYDRITREGKLPGCVEACPVEALTFGKRSDLIRIARERILRNPDKYVDHIYGEHEVGGTSWMYLSGVPFDKIGFRTDLGITPYPELTRGFLSAVPLVLTLWPVFFTGVYMFSRRREQIAKTEDSSHEREEGPS